MKEGGFVTRRSFTSRALFAALGCWKGGVLAISGCQSNQEPSSRSSDTPGRSPEEPRMLRAPGSSVQFTLPRGMQRCARAQWYGQSNPHVLIEVREGQVGAQTARDTAERMTTIYGLVRAYHEAQEPSPMPSKPGFLLGTGTLDRHLDRPEADPVRAKLVVGVRDGALVTLVATYQLEGEAVVDEFIASTEIAADTAKDPCAAHGISLEPAAGFRVLTETLDPVVVAPSIASWPVSASGPSLELSFSKPFGGPERALREAVQEQTRRLGQEASDLGPVMFEHQGDPAMQVEFTTDLGGVRVAVTVVAIHDRWGVTSCMLRCPAASASDELPALHGMVRSLRRGEPPLVSS